MAVFLFVLLSAAGVANAEVLGSGGFGEYFAAPAPSPSVSSKNFVEKLSAAAKKAAEKCRTTASWLRRKGIKKLCGAGRSKGMCYQAVKEAMRAVGVQLTGGSAHMAHTQGQLSKAGFVNLLRNGKAPNPIPAGAVLVYTSTKKQAGHTHGHIEIKTKDGKYCSDFCSKRPMRNRTLVGVYILPGGGA